MHNIFQRVRKQKQQQKRYEKGLPAMKKDDFAKRLQELSARQPSSGYQPNRLVMLEHLEQAQSISNYLDGRFHEMYAAPAFVDEDGDSDELAQHPHSKTSSKSVLEPLKPLKTSRTTKELVPRSNHAASKLKPAHSTTDLIDVDTHVAAPVERKLPPLYYRMQQVWGTSLTSSVSEEERLGLPTTENARMLFGIDIYEAKGIVRAFGISTVESLYQLYTKERIYGREGQMRENMAKAVYSTRTSTRIMAILKQIDAFSIFLDAKPKKDVATPRLAGPTASDVPLIEADETVDDEDNEGADSLVQLDNTMEKDPAKNAASVDSALPTASANSTDTATTLTTSPRPNGPATGPTQAEVAAAMTHPHVDLVGVYFQQCAVQHVLPSKRVMRQLPTNVVNCAHYNMGSDAVVTVCRALQWNTSLVELNLTDNWSLEAGGHELAQVVGSCLNLKTLDLTNNRVGTQSAIDVLRAATVSSSMARLVLKGNNLCDRIHSAIGALLARNKSLRFLDMSDNRLRNKTGAAVGDALLDNTHLETLHLTWNTMSTTGCLPILSALATNKTLKHLSLGWNRLGDETGCFVATMLVHNCTLESLDLSSAQLSCASIGFLADAVTFNDGLVRLTLDQNPIDQTGLSLMLQAAKQREKNKKHSLRLSLDHMVFKHREADAPRPPLPYDPRDPSGYYRFNLRVPAERTAFELLKIRHKLGLGTFHHVVANKFKIDANHLDRIPANATVRFEYIATRASTSGETADDLIHFRLDLAKPADRAMARALMQRAEAETGENWLNETLDGVPFNFDEQRHSDTKWLDLHPTGVLELDYLSTTLFCESHYKLHLDDKSDRAMAWKLLERVQRSNINSRNNVGDEWRNLTLDGAALSLDAWTIAPSVAMAALPTATKWKWRVPMQGTIEFDFFTPHPHHVLAHHYRLDLTNDADRVLAHELRVRSLEGIGECWWNEMIDGYPFRLSESLDKDFDFPHRGILEFDFILLRPAHFVTTMEVDECQFDLGDYDDYIRAECLRRVAATDSNHYVWTNASINGKSYVFASNTMLPPTGVLQFSGLVFLGKDPSPADMTAFLLEQLALHADNPDRQKYLLEAACGIHEHDDLQHRDTPPMFFTSAMVPDILRTVASEKHQAEALQIVWPTVLDKSRLVAKILELKCDGPPRWFGAGTFAAFEAAVLDRFLRHRLHFPPI